MRIVAQPHELKPVADAVCLAIGVFDGVHLGHQAVIHEAVAHACDQHALPIVITFDRHPMTVVAPGRAPLMISPLAQRLEAMERLGVAAAVVIPFDESFSRKHGKQFLDELIAEFPPIRSMSVGAGFTFGFRRSGNVALMHRSGHEHGFVVFPVRELAVGGQPVSSTRIRQLIGESAFAEAGLLLGRRYALQARIVPGDQLGRQLGFPTANLETTGMVIPANGVYAVTASIAGRRHRGVVNIGTRPTLGTEASATRVELHVLDFAGDLYGQTVEAEFERKLRDERRFESLQALTEQIRHDTEQARAER